MTKSKFSGHDVNGWRDYVTQNRHSLSDNDDQIDDVGAVDAVDETDEVDEVDEVVLIESGPLTSVVKVTKNSTSTWVGGHQADIAPHGTGAGWGEIGSKEHRTYLKDLLERHDSETVIKLSVAFESRASGAGRNVIAVNDTPDTTELVREYILAAAGEARLQKPMLVWRPVLAAIHAQNENLVLNEKPVSEENKIAIISQSASGLSVQTLRLREKDGFHVFERHSTGEEFKGDIGYAALVDRARKAAIESDRFSTDTMHLARARSVGRLALGLPCPVETLRQSNGDWCFLDLGNHDVLPETLLDDPLPNLDDCTDIFIETLAEGPVRDALFTLVKRETGCEPILLPPNAVANGALVAADKFNKKEPVYLDFLPCISTIIKKRGNHDLIDKNETLEADKVYRSPEPAEFHLPAGTTRFAIYMRKETESRPRKSVIDLGVSLEKDVRIKMRVEQKPTSGRAAIIIEVHDLRRTFRIDWDKSEVDERDWEEIINRIAML